MWRRGHLCAAVVSAILAWSAASAAQVVSYDAPLGCPDESALVDEIRARSAHWPHLRWANGEVRVSVRVRAETAETIGAMSIEDGARHVVGSREIRGATCAEVTQALAAFVALTLDTADVTHPPTAAPAPTSPPVLAPAPCTPIAPPPPPAPVRIALGVAVGLRTGTTGPIAPTFSLGVELSRIGANAWGFGLRARALGGYSFPLAAGVGYATLELGAVAIEPCVLRRIGDHVRFALCAATEIGALFIQGRNLVTESDVVKPWGSVGAAATVGFSSTQALTLELGIGALVPLLRPDISAAGARVFEVEPVGIALTASAHLPLP